MAVKGDGRCSLPPFTYEAAQTVACFLFKLKADTSDSCAILLLNLDLVRSLMFQHTVTNMNQLPHGRTQCAHLCLLCSQ